MALPLKTFIRSKNHASVRMNLKQSNSPPSGSLNSSEIQRKLFVKKSLWRKLWAVASAKLLMWRLFHLSIVGRSILSGTPQIVCLKSSEKFEQEKTNQCSPTPYWLAIKLMGHPRYSPDLAPNDLCLLPHIRRELLVQRFSSPEDTIEAFKNHVSELSQSVWKNKHKWWSYIKTCWVALC